MPAGSTVGVLFFGYGFLVAIFMGASDLGCGACGCSCCSSGAVLRLRGLRGLHVGCLHAVRAHLRALCLAMQLKASFFICPFLSSSHQQFKPLPGIRHRLQRLNRRGFVLM